MTAIRALIAGLLLLTTLCAAFVAPTHSSFTTSKVATTRSSSFKRDCLGMNILKGLFGGGSSGWVQMQLFLLEHFI
jgi:hypothetical protein